jgi:hypothetical protein
MLRDCQRYRRQYLGVCHLNLLIRICRRRYGYNIVRNTHNDDFNAIVSRRLFESMRPLQ